MYDPKWSTQWNTFEDAPLIVELSVGMARDKGSQEGGEGQMVCLLCTFLKI